MARRPFGGTPSDVVQDARGNARQRATGTAWTAQVGGTQIADLAAPDGTLLPGGVITAGQRGEVQFLGSDDDRAALWADFGNGRFLMLATDLPNRVEALSTEVDLHDERLGDVETALPLKADLVAGTIPDTQIPPTIARDAEVTSAVSAAVAALVAGAPGALDTLNELATQLATDESAASALTSAVALRGIDVSHGSTAGTSRPTSTLPVTWHGTVAPTNAVARDLWYDEANDLVKRYSGSAWVAAGSAAYPTFAAMVMLPQQMFSGSVVIDGNGNESSASLRWPDGDPGTYTLLSTDGTSLEPSSWSCTKGSPVTKTFTQPTMTFDADGNPLTRPAITVAP